MEKERTFENLDMFEKFANYPPNVKKKLLVLRELIFDVASKTKKVGKLEETFRWDEPSYLTTESHIGSMIRINKTKTDGQCAMYFHCQTSLVATFREIYPELTYQGNRAIIFNEGDKIPTPKIRRCISLALTYNLDK